MGYAHKGHARVELIVHTTNGDHTVRSPWFDSAEEAEEELTAIMSIGKPNDVKRSWVGTRRNAIVSGRIDFRYEPS